MQRTTLIAGCIVAWLMTIVLVKNFDRPIQQVILPPPTYIPVVPVPPISVTPPPAPSVNDALASIKRTDLQTKVAYLASPQLEGRKAGSRGCQLAADYIENVFKNAGYRTMRDPFATSGGSTENVYGWRDGQTDQIIVVGAHYDHLGRNHPGADDNASGTALVLQLAQAFSILPPMKKTIVFQLYSAEETGLHGSAHYCRQPKFPINQPSLQKHVFMLNADMIGYLNKSNRPESRATQSPSAVNTLVRSLSTKYHFAPAVSFTGGSGSDNASFARATRGQMPVLWLFTGSHNNYHTPADTPEKLNYEGMEQITRYAFEIVYCVSERGVPQTKTIDFQDQPSLYDHDDPRMPFPNENTTAHQPR